MKKFLSLFLSMVMVLSLGVVVFAEDYSTDVSYTGEYTDASTGEHTEYFEVTVPAAMTPGETKEVLADGTWPSTRTLSVTAPSSVTLTNSIDGGTKVLDVTFNAIALDGSNTVEVSTTENISVAEINNALFGTWEGTIAYTVSMGDKE